MNIRQETITKKCAYAKKECIVEIKRDVYQSSCDMSSEEKEI